MPFNKSYYLPLLEEFNKENKILVLNQNTDQEQVIFNIYDEYKICPLCNTKYLKYQYYTDDDKALTYFLCEARLYNHMKETLLYDILNDSKHIHKKIYYCDCYKK
jgi:hypothetical protein